jgi:hypothetical protein
MPQLELPLTYTTKTGKPDKHRGVPAYDRGNVRLGAWTRAVRAYATRLIEYGYLSEDARTYGLERRLRQMGYDDALHCGPWRVELLYIGSGQPHFRVYWRGRVFGVAGIYTSHADLAASRNMDTVRRMLAAYLVFWQWRPECVTLIRQGARTCLEANTDHQYRLFHAPTRQARTTRYDALRDREAV